MGTRFRLIANNWCTRNAATTHHQSGTLVLPKDNSVVLKDGRIRCSALVAVDRGVGFYSYVAGNRWPEPGNGYPESPPSSHWQPKFPIQWYGTCLLYPFKV